MDGGLSFTSISVTSDPFPAPTGAFASRRALHNGMYNCRVRARMHGDHGRLRSGYVDPLRPCINTHGSPCSLARTRRYYTAVVKSSTRRVERTQWRLKRITGDGDT